MKLFPNALEGAYARARMQPAHVFLSVMRRTSINCGFLSIPILSLGACNSEPPGDPLTEAYPGDLCSNCAQWNEPQPPFQIFGNTYYVGTRGLASILITSPDGHVLIDGGLPDSAPLIQENIEALGFDIRDVELILNTHAHFDHAGGIAALRRASGGRVAASRSSASTIRRGTPDPEDPQYGDLLDFHLPSVAEVEEFRDGETLTLGLLSLTPYLTPAHSPGGTTWSWRACEADVCLDLVFGDSQTLLSAEGFRFSESAALADFERGFALLEGTPCDILITPHPGQSSFWERRESGEGLVDPSACGRYARAAREQLERRLATEADSVREVDLSHLFEGNEPVDAAFVLVNGMTGATARYNPIRAAQRFVPASTFKIPNSLIALETGVATGPDFTIPYDSLRVRRDGFWTAEWSRDHTLRSAFQNSVYWYYQEIARRVGEPGMIEYLERFDYGNQDTGGGLDRFWLEGDLRISPNEQVRFLQDLLEGRLGVSDRSTALLKEIMVLEATPAYTLSGKTGTADITSTRELAWLVGYVECDDLVWYYALNVEGEEVWERWGQPTVRRALVLAILRELGVVPAEGSD